MKYQFILITIASIAIVSACKKKNSESPLTPDDVLVNSYTSDILRVESNKIKFVQNPLVFEANANESLFTDGGVEIRNSDQELVEVVHVSIKDAALNTYEIITKEPLATGGYTLGLFKGGKRVYFKAFSIKDSDPNEPTAMVDLGNFQAFKPLVKDFSDGVKITILDAELGYPSFYNAKISLPATLFSSTATVRTAINTYLNHSVAGLAIRESFITGYDPALPVTSASKPIYNFYDESINGVAYKSAEYLVYLTGIPDPATSYSATLLVTGVGLGSYKSADFKFRSAFTKEEIVSFDSNSPLNLFINCFALGAKKVVKCLGSNIYGATGYDNNLSTIKNRTSNLVEIDLPLYRLPAVEGYENARSVVSNGYSTCVESSIVADATSDSYVRCFGVNYKAGLGVDDIKIALPLNGYWDSATQTDFSYVKPGEAVYIEDESDEKLVISKIVTSPGGNFCGYDKILEVYCWGTAFSPMSLASNYYRPFHLTKLAYTDLIGSKNNIRKHQFIILANSGTWALCSNGVYSGASNYIINFCYSLTSAKGDYLREFQPLVLTDYTGQNTFYLNTIAKGNTDLYCYANTGGKVDCAQTNIAKNDFAVTSESGTNGTFSFRPTDSDSNIRLLAVSNKVLCYTTSGSPGVTKCDGPSADMEGGVEYNNYKQNLAPYTAGKTFSQITNKFPESQITVENLTAGTFSVCADLSMMINGVKQYASKCWGGMRIAGMSYYTPESKSQYDTIYFQYHPVMRW